MSALPPYKESLKLHSAQANYVAKMWRLFLQGNIQDPKFRGYGWEWIHNPFMDNIFLDPLLVKDDYESGSKQRKEWWFLDLNTRIFKVVFT